MNFVEQLIDKNIDNHNKFCIPRTSDFPEMKITIENIVKLCVYETAKEIIKYKYPGYINDCVNCRIIACQELINQTKE